MFDLEEKIIESGNYLISLAVKDIMASQVFYEKLAFKVLFGDITQNLLILKNWDQQ